MCSHKILLPYTCTYTTGRIDICSRYGPDIPLSTYTHTLKTMLCFVSWTCTWEPPTVQPAYILFLVVYILLLCDTPTLLYIPRPAELPHSTWHLGIGLLSILGIAYSGNVLLCKLSGEALATVKTHINIEKAMTKYRGITFKAKWATWLPHHAHHHTWCIYWSLEITSYINRGPGAHDKITISSIALYDWMGR